MTHSRRDRRRTALAIAAGVIAVLVLVLATLPGVGLSRDSAAAFHYAGALHGHEPLRSHGRLSSFVTQVAPGYPILLAIASSVIRRLPHAARWINVTCFAASAVTATLLAWRLAWPPRSARVVIAVVLFFAQYAIVSIHLWAGGEAPFLFLTLLLAYVLTGRGGAGRAAGVGGLILAATLTRFVGLALLPGACLTIWRTAAPGRRWRELGVLLATAAGPLLIAVVVQRVTGSPGAKAFELHRILPTQWFDLRMAFEHALAAPVVFGPFAWVVGVVLLVAAAWPALRRRRPGRATVVLVPMAVSYVVFLVVSVIFVGTATPLDDRLLSPAIALLTIWLATTVPPPRVLRRQAMRRTATAGLMVIVVGVVLTGAVRSAGQFIELNQSGLGFGNVRFETSPLMTACRRLKPGVLVASNYPEAVFLYAGRDAVAVPAQTASTQAAVDPLAAKLRGVPKGGYVAYFNFHAGRKGSAGVLTFEQLKAAMPLKRVGKFSDGVLLRVVDKPAK